MFREPLKDLSERKPPVRHKRKGFTLIEILAITVIIALVVGAVLVPTLQAVRRRAKEVICANNLKRLAQAIGTRRSDEMRGQVAQLSPAQWQKELAAYLPLDSNDLVCPEYEEGTGATPVEAQFRFHMWASGVSYYVDLDSPNVAKMSKTQYEAAKAAKFLQHGAKWSDYTAYQGYEDDGSGEVVYAMEENDATHKYQAGVALDFEEVALHVKNNGDGTVELSVDLGSGSTGTSIVPMSGGRKPIGGLIFGGGHGREAPDPATVASSEAGLASYGVNNKAASLQGAGKILAMDYIYTIASPKHEWSNMGQGEKPGTPVFARHRGRMNAAFMDTTVRLMDPADIDPIAEDASETYWLPSR